MTDKPTKWGMKGFTLAESTFRFITYTVKTLKASDAVLCLMMWWWTFFSCCLAQDAMFTWTVVLYQSQMFLDLTSTRCGACSIYTGNAWEGGKILSTKKCELGSVRWIRDDPLDIVKWMDTWEVPVCTTIHLYVQGEEKGGGCRWTLGCERGWHTRPVHSVLVHPQQDCCRYGTVLLHFLEIETRKAFILHREAISAMQVLPMAHKEFVAELVCQHGDRHSSQQKRWEDCVPIVTDNNAVQKGTKGKRLFIHRLEVDSKRSDTPRKYQDCDVPLCLVVDRNCFCRGILLWHLIVLLWILLLLLFFKGLILYFFILTGALVTCQIAHRCE